MKTVIMNQLLNYILTPDRAFYITNPERSKDFHYSKKSFGEKSDNRSGRTLHDAEKESATPEDIKNIIAARPGTLFISSLILSCLILVPVMFAGWLFSIHWTAYSSYFIIYPAAAYIIYNIRGSRSLKVYLYYKIEGGRRIFSESLLDSMYELSGSDNVWHVESITPNKKKNSHGGAEEIYHRHSVKIKKSPPGFVKANVNVWSIKLQNAGLYFLPDCIIIENHKKYQVIDYETLSVDYIEKLYFETGSEPGDAVKTGTVWLHPKKGGNADRRFRKNRKIPVMLYAELKLSSGDGEGLHFQVSNLRTARIFYRFLSQQAAKYSEQLYKKPENSKRKKQNRKAADSSDNGETENKDNRNKENKNEEKRSDVKPGLRDEIEKAFLTLGLPVGASPDEIRRAYYRMAKRFHPDLISNKKPDGEFEEKMKEINRAYEKLKH